jgi:hypothetical protein
MVVRIAQKDGPFYLLEGLKQTFYLWNMISSDVFHITYPTTYDAIVGQIGTKFENVRAEQLDI